MRLLSLTLKKVRGMPDFTCSPGGKTVVFYGPNGSGKSAVVNAVDLILTGRDPRV